MMRRWVCYCTLRAPKGEDKHGERCMRASAETKGSTLKVQTWDLQICDPSLQPEEHEEAP